MCTGEKILRAGPTSADVELQLQGMRGCQ
ncbi:hypothetical protein LINPERHAP1_LOCUS23527 [Linum perenne]